MKDLLNSELVLFLVVGLIGYVLIPYIHIDFTLGIVLMILLSIVLFIYSKKTSNKFLMVILTLLIFSLLCTIFLFIYMLIPTIYYGKY